MYVYTNKISHIFVCIHIYIYWYSCMFTKYKRLRNQLKYLSTKSLQNHLRSITQQTKLMFIISITFGIDILDLKDYGPENNRGYRYVLVIIDNFSKFGWTVPTKNKNAQTIKDSFKNILIGSKRKPNLIESDRGKEFYNNIFQDFLIKNNIKHYSRNSSNGAVFAERFNRTIGDLSNDLFFKRVMVIGLIFYPQ